MKILLPLLLGWMMAPFILFAQNITVKIVQAPSNYEKVVDTTIQLSVEVDVDGVPTSVKTVTAAAGGRQANLTYDNLDLVYKGQLNLGRLSGDTMALKFTATDDLGNTGDTTVYFVYRPLNDPGVTITIDSLADLGVAHPLIRLNARSAGSTIRIIKLTYPDRPTFEGDTLLTAKDSVPTVDLSIYDGSQVRLKVQVTDSTGRTAEKLVWVYVENSPYLIEHYTATAGRIIDFKENKVLTVNSESANPVIQDITNGQRSPVLLKGSIDGLESVLTPYGAIIFTPTRALYEWNNGSLSLLTANSFRFSTAGKYVAWYNQGVKLKDMSTGKIDTITSGDFRGSVQVAENGLVVFDKAKSRTGDWWFENALYKYQNGQLTTLVDSNQVTAYVPATDGRRIIYGFSTMARYPDKWLYLLDERGKFVLTTSETIGYTDSKKLVDMNSAYIALSDASGIYLFDTARQRTLIDFPFRTELERLNTKGEMMVIAPVGRLFVNKAGGNTRITSSIGGSLSKAFYVNNGWYVAIGRVLFKVDTVSAGEPHLSDFTKRTKQDSVLAFTEKDFTDHFSGAGALSEVTFTAIPRHGKLRYYNNVVPVGYTIGTGYLKQLTYVPDSAYTGRDTVRWTGATAYQQTDTAAIYITVTDSTGGIPVPQPVVTGLNSTYCGTLSNQHIKIINLPDVSTDIIVKVLLDNTTTLPVAADSTFTLQPNALAVGKHHLEVSYTRDTAHKALQLDFEVKAAVTPEVDLGVNVNPITNDTTPVIFTATNVSGTKQPLYTFARDRDFSNILQMEGAGNKATVAPTVFALGDNWVYVRMRGSESCSTAPTALDSIKVTKTNITGIIDIDFPKEHINPYPNPFRGQFTIKGLQPVKSYLISLYDMQGRLMYNRRAVNRSTLNVNEPSLGPGIYILKVFDEKKGRLLGTVKLLNY